TVHLRARSELLPLQVSHRPCSTIGAARPSAQSAHDCWQARRMSVGTLVLLRHGESEWNAKNLFTGWVDVPLSARGEREAVRSGELMRQDELLPDVVHTSLLRRAITTANLALDAADRHWIPVRRDWRLNERHYGALQLAAGFGQVPGRHRCADHRRPQHPDWHPAAV